MKGIPAGYRRMRKPSPFNALIGPLYARRAKGKLSIGMRIEAKHTNSRGSCHGGVLATLADLSLGYAMAAHLGARRGFVTAHLAVDFAGSAGPGDWIASEVEIQRIGTRLAFANCYLVANGKRIVRASAIFAHAAKRA